jgi:glycogen operon protein
VKALNAFRQRRDVLVEGSTLSLNELLRRARIEWHGVELHRTSLSSPEDICPWEKAPFVTEPTYAVPPRASAFLVLPLHAVPGQRHATGKEG